MNGINTSISTENLPAGFAGILGKLCFDADRRAQIEAMIAKAEMNAGRSHKHGGKAY